jgi:hypothetical protein
MKKIIVTLTLSICLLGFSNAQTFSNGDMVFNGGIGVGYSYGLYSGANSTPLLFLSGEKGMYDLENIGVISVGGVVAFKHISYDAYGYDWSWNDFYIGGRGILHVNDVIEVENVDLYLGISLGLRIYSYPTYTTGVNLENESFTRVFSGGFFGARYYFNEKFAGMAELGYDIAWLKLGVSYKL